MNSKYLNVTLNNIDVWCVSVKGVKNSEMAFNKLKSKLPTLRGRRFYGVLEGAPNDGRYRACVAKQLGEKIAGVDSWVIPGGKYVRVIIKDWEKQIEVIAKTFREMSDKYAVDFTRPTIENYRSQKELVLYLPIL